MTRQLTALACRASLSLDLYAEAAQGSSPQFPYPSSGSVLLEGMGGSPGVHWKGSHSSEKGGITSLQGTRCPLGKEDAMVTQQRQLRAAHSLEELPGAGTGDGAKEPGSGRSGQRSLSCPTPATALQLTAQIWPLWQQRLKNRGWNPPLGRGVHQSGATAMRVWG